MFVNPDERVPVTLGENTIYIRAKMSVGIRARVEDALEIDPNGDVANLGSYIMALLKHNILGWEGPAFAGVPCTPENIMRLDPEDPLVRMVRDEIARRNAPKEEPQGN